MANPPRVSQTAIIGPVRGAYGNIPRDSNGRITGPPSGAALTRTTTTVYSVTTAQVAGTGTETVNDDPNAYWNTNAPNYRQGAVRSVISGAGRAWHRDAEAEMGFDESQFAAVELEQRQRQP